MARTTVNPTRKTKLEDLAAIRQNSLWQSKLLPQELVDEKLSQLQTFIQHLAETPYGRDEIEGRRERFGDCQQVEGETPSQFYCKLRHWLDRNMDPSNSRS